MGAKSKIAVPKMGAWETEQCPACESTDVSVDYYTGEVFCLKCGLVIY